LASALVLAVAGALLTVYIVNRMIRRLRWQTEELARLSSRTMSDHEEMAHRLSREMHDQFGQTLSAIEANLVAMQHMRTFHNGRIEDCLGLVKDAVQNVREVSQLLRPSILDEFGLSASLRWLAEGFAERTGKSVRFDCTYNGRLEGNVETQIFRIAQEALTNVARHSNADSVEMEFHLEGDRVTLKVADNGEGIDSHAARQGSGMVGMRARARAIGANLKVSSARGEGVTILVQVPQPKTSYVSQDSNFVSR
jgi:signal transduction histidine kinase